MRTQIQAYEDTDRAASYFVEEHRYRRMRTQMQAYEDTDSGV
jgi:hypothetical protein